MLLLYINLCLSSTKRSQASSKNPKQVCTQICFLRLKTELFTSCCLQGVLLSIKQLILACLSRPYPSLPSSTIHSSRSVRVLIVFGSKICCSNTTDSLQHKPVLFRRRSLGRNVSCGIRASSEPRLRFSKP